MSEEELQEETLLSHLIELRSRLLKAGSAVLLLFVVLIPFADEVFNRIALPLMNQLPEGSTMIATQVASPFLTPFNTPNAGSVGRGALRAAGRLRRGRGAQGRGRRGALRALAAHPRADERAAGLGSCQTDGAPRMA